MTPPRSSRLRSCLSFPGGHPGLRSAQYDPAALATALDNLVTPAGGPPDLSYVVNVASSPPAPSSEAELPPRAEEVTHLRRLQKSTRVVAAGGVAREDMNFYLAQNQRDDEVTVALRANTEIMCPDEIASFLGDLEHRAVTWVEAHSDCADTLRLEPSR